MNNFTLLTKNHKRIAYLLIIGLAFLTTSAGLPESGIRHLITAPKAYITNTTDTKEWSIAGDSITCTGNFTMETDQLQDISGFNFKLPIIPALKAATAHHPALLEALNKSTGNEMQFVQKRVMILPTMRMVHIIGELNLANSTQIVPIQLQYTQETDQQLHFKGKQIIRLSEFGMKDNHIDAASRADEITINIEFTLTKEQVNTSK